VGSRVAALSWGLALALSACGGSGAGGTTTGTRILAGDVDVAGVTDDGFAAVRDPGGGLRAVPLDGGDPQLVDASSDGAGAVHDLIFSYHDFDIVSGIGDLILWTAAGGAVPLASATAGVIAVSDDGTRILLTFESSSDATATNLGVAASDGTPTVVVGPVSRLGGCGPSGTFAGGRFVVRRCDPGSTVLTLVSVDPATGASVDLLAPAGSSFDVVHVPDGDPLVAAVAPDGGAFLVPIAGGTATPLATGVEAVFAAVGGTAVLVRGGGSLRRVPLDGSPPVTLVAASVTRVQALSPDGNAVLFRSMLGQRSYGDLFLAGAAAPTDVTPLVATLDAATPGDAFTPDSSRALFMAGTSDLGVGVLSSVPVAGGPPTVHGQQVWAVRGYGSTSAVFADDYAAVPERPGRASIRAVDTAAAGATPTTIATHAGAAFALTHAGDRVVFSFDDGGDGTGLYVAPLP
jgi:hypothetical protein